MCCIGFVSSFYFVLMQSNLFHGPITSTVWCQSFCGWSLHKGENHTLKEHFCFEGWETCGLVVKEHEYVCKQNHLYKEPAWFFTQEREPRSYERSTVYHGPKMSTIITNEVKSYCSQGRTIKLTVTTVVHSMNASQKWSGMCPSTCLLCYVLQQPMQ